MDAATTVTQQKVSNVKMCSLEDRREAISGADFFHSRSLRGAGIAAPVLIAFLLRIAVIFAFHTYAQQTQPLDAKHLHITGEHFGFGFETGSIAGSLARGEGFNSPFGIRTGPTAWIAPVYPLLCAAVFKIFGIYSTLSAIVILAINSLFAALTCIPIYLIAKRIFDLRVAMLSAWIWSICLFFMRWPTTWIWEVSLSALILATLVVLSFSAVTENGWGCWIKLGLLWGLAAITNPSLLGVLPFSLGWIAFQRHRTLRASFRPILLTVSLIAAVMTPWLARNWIVVGRPVFIRDNFGFEFYLGNYHGSTGLGFLGKHPTQNERQLKLYSQLGELGYVKSFQTEAFQFVKQYPEEFAILTLRRFVSFWDGGMINYEPHGYWRWEPWEMLMLAAPAAFGLLLALAQERRAGATLLGLVVLLYPLPYYFTYAQERYRHAIEPEMLVLSCFFVCALWDHARARFNLGKRAPAKGMESL